MDVSWAILIAPTATLLAVLIERLFSLLTASRQQKLIFEQEAREFALRLVRDELQPILEFADQCIVITRSLSAQYLSIQHELHLTREFGEKRDVEAQWNELRSQYRELRTLSDIAYARAHALPYELSDTVFALDQASMEICTLSREYLVQWLDNGEPIISNDDLRDKSSIVFEESGKLRNLCRQYLIDAFKRGAIPQAAQKR